MLAGQRAIAEAPMVLPAPIARLLALRDWRYGMRPVKTQP
jgi:hypothetical protein